MLCLHCVYVIVLMTIVAATVVAGDRFMPDYDERLELAPRDVVARAIHDQMMTHTDPHVWLDISHKPKAEVLSHFPNIAAKCSELGIDISQDPIPVLPAQHYMCGGVATGLLGDTSIQGLYACGEVACSGLHGANRLASNSLLEGLVFADRAAGPSVAHAEYALRSCGRQLHDAAASADFRGARGARKMTGATAQWVAAKRAEIRDMMWRHCGIVRNTKELRQALDTLAAWRVEVKSVYKNFGVDTPIVELMNLVTIAQLIVSCALQRRESRGLHYSADFPEAVAAEARPSLIALTPASTYELDSMQSAMSVKTSNGYLSNMGVSSGPGRKKVIQRDLSVRSTPQAKE